MNALCYKVIFSKRLGALVAVGENATSQGKSASGAGSRSVEVPLPQATGAGNYFVGSLKVLFTSSVLACMVANIGFAAPATNALPTQGVVQTGAATISTNGAAMTINQATQKASINWNSFNIGSQASVNVVQNNASSVLLNRVVGYDPSQIFGKLTANGQVILINPNGIVFGKGGSVTASAFTASTFGMTDADFQSGKYKYSRNGSTAGVTMEDGATISTTAPGGYVALLGAEVNNQGTISTKHGAVVLAAGESVALPSALTDNVGIPLSGKVRLELAPSAINASVDNSGTITTEGGQVLMQAAAVADAVASITHTGNIDTSGAQGGAVTLQADHGIIKTTGSIKANSNNAKNKGGDIIIGRDEVTGVLAKTTNVSGAKLESQGGFVETSGEHLKTDGVSVKAKDWLLDPTDIKIVDSTNDDSSVGNLTASNSANTDTYQQTGNVNSSEILNTTINSALSNGTNVLIKTTNANGAGNGDITVASNIDVTNGVSTNNDATLTLQAERHIVVKAGKSIKRSGDKQLNVVLNSDSDATNGGGILMESGSSIKTNGGNITMGGGTDATGFAKGTTGNQSGVALMGTTLDAGTGAITLKGQQGDATGSGVLFNGTNKIQAATYTIEGIAASGNADAIAQNTIGHGVLFKAGATTLNSNTGASTVTGTTSGTGWGVFGYTGNTIDVNSGAGSAVIQSSANSANGVRFGWNKGIKINTSGDVTLGSHANDTAGLTIQADVISSGKLTLKGKTKDTNNAINITEGAGNGAGIIGTAATVKIHGISTGSGTGVHMQPGGVANSLSSTGTGSFEIIGESVTGSGVRVGATTITSGGSTKITGTVTGGAGDGVTSTGTVNASSIEIRGTAVGGRGAVVGATHTATAGIVYIEGNSTSNVATEVSGAVNANGTGVNQPNANITILGTSQNSVGIQLASTLTANNLVTVTGESKANTTGTFFTGTSGVNAASYQVKGISASATGINIDSGTVTFRSTSNTVDSLIEGKGAGWGIQKRSGTLNLTNKGSAKITMQSAADSNGGGLLIGSANGLTVNTEGNVTIGSSTHNNALLTIQLTTFNANGGSLALKGKSTGNGITMQDASGYPVQILGTNDAKISLEGVSSGSGTGVILGIVSNTSHNIETSGANGSISILGTSQKGDGVNTLNSRVTAKDGSKIYIEGHSSATDGTGTGVAMSSGIKAKDTTSTNPLGGTITVIGTSAGTGNGIFLNTNGGAGAIEADSGAVVLNGTAIGATAGLGVFSSGSIKGTSVEITGNSNAAQGVYSSSSGSITATTGNAVVKGESTKAVATHLQSAVIGQTGVEIEGTSNSTTTNSRSVLIENTITAETGNITVTGRINGNTSDTGQRAVTLVGSNSKLVAKDGNIGINADTFFINTFFINTGSATMVSAAGTGKGVVAIKTTTDGRDVVLGSSDSAIKLGIDQGEIAKISANKLVIGDTAKGGSIHIEAAVDASHIDTLSLQTKSDKALTQATPALPSTVGSVTAKNLEIISSAVTLENKSNAIQTVAANATSLKLVNKQALEIGTVNGTNGITTEAGSSVLTQTGDLTIKNSVTNTGATGDIVLGAGVSHGVNEGADSNIKTPNGVSVSNANPNGKTYIYTGSTSGTGKLGNLMGSLATLYLSKVGDNVQNAQLNTAYANSVTSPLNTIQNGAATQVIFRENTQFDEIQINPTTLTKIQGQVDPSSASFIAAVDAANAEGATLSKVGGTELKNTFKISAARASIVGSLATPATSTGTYNYDVISTTSIAKKVTSTDSAQPPVKLIVQASNVNPIPVPVVPTNNTSRVKVPVDAANPFQLASAEDLADEVCSANSLENCYCEESPLTPNVDICYEPKTSGKGPAR